MDKHVPRGLNARSIISSSPVLHPSNLHMSSGFERESPKQAASEGEAEKVEVAVAEEEEDRGGISDSMKERLRREMRSQGADPNYSAGPVKGNPILIVSGVLALLVILGGKGIFY